MSKYNYGRVKKWVYFVFLCIGCCFVWWVKYQDAKMYTRKLFYDLQHAHPLYIFHTDVFKKYHEECFRAGRVCPLVFGQNVLADMMRLRNIQYVGKLITRHDVPYLLEMIDTLTNINPYWSYPYVFAQLLGPIAKTTEVSDDKKKSSWIKTVSIAEKGLTFTCNSGYVEFVEKLNDQDFSRVVLAKRAEGKNVGTKNKKQFPCADFQLPLHTAFNYFYYLKNGTQAIKRYKVAAMDVRSPEITVSMPAVVLGQFGYHQKSALLWYDKYLTTLSQIQNLSPDNKQKLLAQADRFLRKAIFEYSLDVLSRAADAASLSGLCLHDYHCLVRYGFLKKHIEASFHKCNSIQKFREKENTVSGQYKEDENFSPRKLEFQLCTVFFHGLERGYINVDGNLAYPFNDSSKVQFEYGRHPLSEQWRIVPKK